MARFSTVVTLRNVDEAHMTVEGAVEPNESRQIVALLATLVDIGARQLFVDLAHVETCDPDLPEFLNDLRRRMTSLGGWVIVDRSPATLGDDTLALDELFAVYTRVATPHPPIGHLAGPGKASTGHPHPDRQPHQRHRTHDRAEGWDPGRAD
jgi:hypothetical protein